MKKGIPIILCLTAIVLLSGCDGLETILGPKSTVPESPTGLTVKVLSAKSIRLSWTDASSTETGFHIERKTGENGSFERISSPAAGATDYTDTGLTAETRYTYRLCAWNEPGVSGWSNEASGVTLEISTIYLIHLAITAQDTNYANAHAYVDNFKFVDNIVFKVDDTILEEKAEYDNYSCSLSGDWSDGSVHTYSITLPEGQTVTGTIMKPVGTITGATYNPPSPTIAASYTVSPPPGGWPQDTCVTAHTLKSGPLHYAASRNPVGNETPIFNGDIFTGAIEVKFEAAKQKKVPLGGFATGSYVSVTGTATPW